MKYITVVQLQTSLNIEIFNKVNILCYRVAKKI